MEAHSPQQLLLAAFVEPQALALKGLVAGTRDFVVVAAVAEPLAAGRSKDLMPVAARREDSRMTLEPP